MHNYTEEGEGGQVGISTGEGREGERERERHREGVEEIG